MNITIENLHIHQSESAMARAFLQAMLRDEDEHEANAMTPGPTASFPLNLADGEHYAGIVIDEDGDIKHNLVLMAPRPTGELAWQAAMDWAESVGGSLPSRQEQALLFANVKSQLKPQWHWTSEAYDASYAWICGLSHGYQDYFLKSYEGSAVAVRRIPAF